MMLTVGLDTIKQTARDVSLTDAGIQDLSSVRAVE